MTMTVSNIVVRRTAGLAALAVAFTCAGCGSSTPDEVTSIPAAEVENDLVRDAQRLIEAIEVERAEGVVESPTPMPEAPRLQRDPFGRLADDHGRSHDPGGRSPNAPRLNGPTGLVSLQAIMTFSGRPVAMIDGRALHVGEQLAAGGRIWTVVNIDQHGRSVTLENADNAETYIATVNSDAMEM